MTLSPRLACLFLPVLAAAALAAGCGDDEEPASETVPTTSPAETESRTDKATTDETGTEPTPDDAGQNGSGDPGPSGGTPAPDPSRPDSPENDVPPPPGSPAERFEQECQVNPQACQ